MYNIYKLTSKTSGKMYVGQTKRNVSFRLAEHKFNASNRPHCELHGTILENGIEDISIEIIEICEDAVADIREQYWISFYDSANPEVGFNRAKGGRGNPGMPVSEETRQKIREKNKGFTPEAREIIRLKAIGRKLSDSHAEVARLNGMKIAKAILQYSVSGELLNEFPSIIEASRATNTDRRTIQRQLSGEYAMNGSGRSTSNLKFIWRRK